MNVCPRLQPRQLKHLAIGSILTTAVMGISFASFAQSVPGRWLQVQRVTGTVTLLTGNSKPAQVGNRLSTVGHGLVTGNRSSAHLSVDDGIGGIAVSQNTRIAIRQLSVLPDGSKVTVIDVPRGQARLQVRRFTHDNSRLELHTPSGVAAVRGTEFGVSVEQNGQTNVATLEGQVEASAQSVVVPVDAGMVSIIHPGDPPTPARPLDRELEIEWNGYEWKNDRFYISGRIDAANTLLAMGEELPVGRTGHFEETLQLTDRSPSVVLTVQNALGETRQYRLLPWLSHDED